MNLKKWLWPKRLWLRGGMIGVAACLVLFVFNIAVYFPFIEHSYSRMIEDSYGGTMPGWVIFFPLITGHFFPLLSGFIVPYGFLCKFTEPICTSWSVEITPGSVPWTMAEGGPGYCETITMTPTASCANLSEAVGFFGLAILLLLGYFLLGAFVGWLIQRKRSRIA